MQIRKDDNLFESCPAVARVGGVFRVGELEKRLLNETSVVLLEVLLVTRLGGLTRDLLYLFQREDRLKGK